MDNNIKGNSSRVFLHINFLILGLFLSATILLASSDPGTMPPVESIVAEPELVLEDWMTLPFESTFAEPELVVEDWMTLPFATSVPEEEAVLED